MRTNSMTKRRFSTLLLLCLALVLSFIAIRAVRSYSFAPLRPPPGVVDIRDFARQMPPPDHLYFVENDGRTHIVWIGGVSRPPVPSSGPACYVFDATGRMVDWCDETDEGHAVDRFYHKRRDAEQVTLDEALRFVAQTTAGQSTSHIRRTKP